MKKRYGIGAAVIVLLCLVIALVIKNKNADGCRVLAKPDRIEIEWIGEGCSYELEPEDQEFDEMYTLVKNDWDRTRKQEPDSNMVFLQQDHLNEEENHVGTAVHFYYEETKIWKGKNAFGPVKAAHYYSFFPLDLEYAAVTENKEYYKAANLPVFQAGEELKTYVRQYEKR